MQVGQRVKGECPVVLPLLVDPVCRLRRQEVAFVEVRHSAVGGQCRSLVPASLGPAASRHVQLELVNIEPDVVSLEQVALTAAKYHSRGLAFVIQRILQNIPDRVHGNLERSPSSRAFAVRPQYFLHPLLADHPPSIQ